MAARTKAGARSSVRLPPWHDRAWIMAFGREERALRHPAAALFALIALLSERSRRSAVSSDHLPAATARPVVMGPRMTYITYSQRLCLLSAAIVAVTSATSAAAKPQPTPTMEAHAPQDVQLSNGTKVAKPTADPVKNQTFALHGQMTFVVQANRPFRSTFSGTNSLKATGEVRETADVTLYAGLRPWSGAEIWLNGELDQGFGLRNTLGAAGFPNGEAYKVGKKVPYARLPRLFVRQTVNLGGEVQTVEADLNQLRSARTVNRLVLTAGKFGVTDVFDTNGYSHDPRGDFLNWSLIDAGTLDYAADAWGYSIGGAAELYLGRLALRGGFFNLSTIPNGEHLEKHFKQYEAIAEIEERHSIRGHPGKVKVNAFLNHGNMARLSDAVNLAAATSAPADVAAVRHFASRSGASLNIEQELTDNIGVFLRAGVADGRFEAFEFTDIDRTIAGGLSLPGKRWRRPDDHFGLALAINRASRDRKRFLDAGGLGVLTGDGRLPHAGDEHIVECYYDVAVSKNVHVTPDFQLIDHPAYNKDRGPVAILGARFHAQL